MALKTPVIAIIGKPNVGKSTLFNRLVGHKKAVVEDFPGVTRDRNYAYVERYDFPFVLVDTGGIDSTTGAELADEVFEQVRSAVVEADALIAMFDGNAPLTDDDRRVMKFLRACDQPVLYCVNKCDGKEQISKMAEYYKLGVNELHDISALHGQGVTGFLSEVLTALPNYKALVQSENSRQEHLAEVEKLEKAAKAEELVNQPPVEPEKKGPPEKRKAQPQTLLTGDEENSVELQFEEVLKAEDPAEEQALLKKLSYQTSQAKPEEDLGLLEDLDYTSPGRSQSKDSGAELKDTFQTSLPKKIALAIVGRPNVGKSTLLNTLLGERRAVTSDIAGTTRDALDVEITRDGQVFTLIDTAGLRKKARVESGIERYSTLRSIAALSEADVVVLVIDATEGVTEQDSRIAGLAHDQGRGLVIAVNKWDLVEKDHKTVKEFRDTVMRELKFAQYAPVIFISALSGRRCPKILETVVEVAQARRIRVTTPRLNQIVERAFREKNLPVYRGRPVKIYFATQAEIEPPRFVIFLNQPKGMHFSWLRYLKNCLRKNFEFMGTDIKLVCKKSRRNSA